MNDMSGKLYPFNPLKIFQNQDAQQIHGAW